MRGIGGTFLSGAWEAWITDEHGVDGIGRVFLRGTQWSYLGAIVGAILGVAVATVDLGAALVFGGVISILTGLACLLVMPEHGFQRRPVEERTLAGPRPDLHLRQRDASRARPQRPAPHRRRSPSSQEPRPKGSTVSGKRT